MEPIPPGEDGILCRSKLTIDETVFVCILDDWHAGKHVGIVMFGVNYTNFQRVTWQLDVPNDVPAPRRESTPPLVWEPGQ